VIEECDCGLGLGLFQSINALLASLPPTWENIRQADYLVDAYWRNRAEEVCGYLPDDIQ
jgi:hypothetical protein